MPTNECQHTNRDGSESAGIRQSCLHDDCLSVSVGYPQKLPNKPLEQGYPTFFSNLSSHSLMPASHSLMPASCSISASWCSHQSRSYVSQCIPFGFSGKGFVMFELPPRRSRIVCA